jgi:antitoxin component of RelBE/YafQ-DinJ toxin-antitoxin module
MAWQNLNQFLQECWGWSNESSAGLALIASASNVLVGNNPPYSISDFLTFHPQFAGCSTRVTGTIDGATGVVSSLSSVAGLATGQLVTGPGIQVGSLIQSLTPGPVLVTATTVLNNANITVSSIIGIVVGKPISGAGIPANTTVLAAIGNTVTMSNEANANGSNVPLQIGENPSMTLSLPTTEVGTVGLNVFTTPMITAVVMKAFIYLASAQIQSERWCELWPFAMGLFIAHNCEMFIKAYAGGPGSSMARVAEAGLALGVKTSKSAGDVSAGMTALPGLEDWGAYQLTIYGQQLATYAKAIGSGNMLLL